MTTKTEHTPTRSWQFDLWKGQYRIYSDEGFTMVRTEDDSAKDEKIASFIVRAVNSHEELLAFAKLVANSSLIAPEWNEKAKQAITKAKGK